MIRFCFNIGCSESKVIFKWRRTKTTQRWKGFLRSKRSLLVHFTQSQSKLSQWQTNTVDTASQHTEKPALSLRWGVGRGLRRTFFRPLSALNFGVASSLCFKMRVSAKLLTWRRNYQFRNNDFALGLVWKWELRWFSGFALRISYCA